MSKPKGNKNYMNLNAAECLIAFKYLQDNADRLYGEAKILANSGSYGHATSLLIHSSEEYMKAFIIFLDGNGFQFRNRVPGISNIFINHKLRYGLALILTLLAILIDDFKVLLPHIKKTYHLTFDLKRDKEQIQNEMVSYIEKRIQTAIQEVQWFSEAEFLRQDGLYVDYVNEIKTPSDISKTNFDETLLRITRIRTFILEYISSFNSEDNTIIQGLDNLKVQFSVEKWYEKIGGLIELFKDNKKNPLIEFSTLISNFSNELPK
jgi:AbiV family abortive infection protein